MEHLANLDLPGGPQSKAPLGILAPKRVNRSESFKKSTNSMISFFASSQPATSLKFTLTSSLAIFLAVDLPI